MGLRSLTQHSPAVYIASFVLPVLVLSLMGGDVRLMGNTITCVHAVVCIIYILLCSCMFMDCAPISSLAQINLGPNGMEILCEALFFYKSFKELK